jgi:tRNA (guanine37-N1)-methyltransferase
VIFHVLTIFPEFFRSPFEYGVVGKGMESGKIEVRIHDLRKWTSDRHRTVDDRPFGGGEGMLLKPEPIFEAVESIWPERESADRRVVLLSAQGRMFDQQAARRLSRVQELLLICGRYEGVDERVAAHLADDELSIGNYVLSGGELAAAVVIDAVARLTPGVLGNEDSAVWESFSPERDGGLDCPQFTRPAEFRGWKVPDVLIGGNHAEIRKWRAQAALEKTARLRPDLMAEAGAEGSDARQADEPRDNLKMKIRN